MTPSRHAIVKRIFLAVCDLSPEDRELRMREECGSDHELRKAVEALLHHHTSGAGGAAGAREPGDAAEPAVAPVEESEDTAGLRTAMRSAEPSFIGPYRVLHEIGRGGMGIVYLARRSDDRFKQQVAIKVLKRGTDTDDVLARFQQERQLLALLNHPGIARLYDGGETDEGLPYFVMEYVEGQAIDRYCDSHELSIDERINLFRKVCAAVHHAHQNLVVHRDLKPTNILITKDGQPKLLDFGIAKVINPAFAILSAEPTRPELLVMTPEYASPEQVRGEPVGTSSDIYSLGVILYELLSGHSPYAFKTRVRDEIVRLVCEEEPARPSTALTRVEPSAEGQRDPHPTTPEAIGKARGARVERIRRRLAGDLDNIVLMAMRKAPQRRYASASEFAEDLRRHADGLTVSARPDSIGYRAAKFVRRHRAGVAAAILVALLLVGAVAVTTTLWRQASEARAGAERRAADLAAVVGTIIDREYEELEDIHGSIRARRAVLDGVLASLDGVEAELADRPDFAELRAKARLESAQLAWTSGGQHEGDARRSAADAEAARRLYDGLWARGGGKTAGVGLAAALAHLGRIGLAHGATPDEALRRHDEAVAIAQRLVDDAPGDDGALLRLAKHLDQRGTSLEDVRGREAARADWTRAYEIKRDVRRRRPDDPDVTRSLTVSCKRMAMLAEGAQHEDEAIDLYRESLALRRGLLAAGGGGRVREERDVAIDSVLLANRLAVFAADDAAAIGEAYELLASALSILVSLIERNPSDQRLPANLEQALAEGAFDALAIKAQRAGDALAALRDLHRRMQALVSTYGADGPRSRIVELLGTQIDRVGATSSPAAG
jgi:serine/threonine protein kinase